MQDFEVVKLTPNETALLATFHCRCVVEGLTEFTSDTFRNFGFDKALYGDPIHSIGNFFAKLKHFGHVREVGWKRSEIPSNHGRMIRVYRWLP